MKGAVFGGGKAKNTHDGAGAEIFRGNISEKCFNAILCAKCNNGRYHFFGIALPPAGGVNAVTDIPAGAAVFDDGAACTNGLAGDFVFGNHIIAVRCVAQMPQQFHVLVQIVNGIQRRVGEIFPGDGVAPDAERKACIPRFLRAQPKPGCFKWCKIHCGSSFVFSSIDKNMVS